MMSVPDIPHVGFKFVLSALEFIGLIGSAEVVSAMATIPFHPSRRWLGWYNTPGCFGVAKHIWNLANSFQTRPYGNQSPAALPPFDRAGPRFIPAFSRKDTKSGHLGYLIAERCKQMIWEITPEMLEDNSATLSVALLDIQTTDLDHPFPLLSTDHTLLALIPIATSIVTCAICALVSDLYMASVILVGILTNGFASVVIGSGRLTLECPTRSPMVAPPGRGLLVSGDMVAVVRGTELAVSLVKSGRINLCGGKSWRSALRVCSLFYFTELLVQLVLTPQGTTFGQLMFVISLCVSWACTCHFSSFQGKLQREFLFTELGKPEIRDFHVETRTALAVLVCLLLFHDVHHLASPDEYNRILTALLPNTTPVWVHWKGKVVKQLGNGDDTALSHLKVNGGDQGLLSETDTRLLGAMLGDAEAAFREYFYHRSTLPYGSLKEY